MSPDWENTYNQAEKFLYTVLGPVSKAFYEDVNGHISYVHNAVNHPHLGEAEIEESMEKMISTLEEANSILSALEESAEDVLVNQPDIAAGEKNLWTIDQLGNDYSHLIRSYRDVYSKIEESAQKLEESGRVDPQPLRNKIWYIDD